MTDIHSTDNRPSIESQGEVITFYSYKGGTGRSMLLANTAWILASAGKKVLLIDWDLEAPGLHRYLRPFLGDDLELKEKKGVINWLIDYWDLFLDNPQVPVETLVRDHVNPKSYAFTLDTSAYFSKNGGSIDLLCAGRQDRFYAESVSNFDYTALYEKLHGEELIDVAKEILVGPGGYDFVLVDSRTGVSDTSGFCTVALADTVVVCFTYNNQSVIGASGIARDIKSKAEARRLALSSDERRLPLRSFRLFAVPSRVDEYDSDRLERRQKHAWQLFEDLLTDIPKDQQKSYWLSVQVKNQSVFAYEEVLAICVNQPEVRGTVLDSVVQLVSNLTKGGITDVPPIEDTERRALRKRFSRTNLLPEAAQPLSAWQIFTFKVPELGSRAAILNNCFSLLIQLYTIPTTLSRSKTQNIFVRSTLQEADLNNNERRMAEILLSLRLLQRRLTKDNQPSLTIADDSVAHEWSELREKLIENRGFIELRTRIQEERIGWDSAGQPIALLKAFKERFSNFDPSSEQLLWLGRANLQFLKWSEQVYVEEKIHTELSRTKEAGYTDLIDELKERNAQLQSSQRAISDRDAVINKEKVEKLRAKAVAAIWRTIMIATLAVVFILLPFFAHQIFLEIPLRERSERFIDSRQAITTIDISPNKTSLNAQIEDLRTALSALQQFSKGLSGTAGDFRLVLPPTVRLGSKIIPPAIIPRKLFDYEGISSEKQLDGAVRVLLTTTVWPVNFTFPQTQKITPIEPKGACYYDTRQKPVRGKEEIYIAANSVKSNTSPPRALIVILDEQRSPLGIYSVASLSGSSDNITGCVAGQQIWFQRSDIRYQVAFDETLQYLFELSGESEIKYGTPPPSVTITELGWEENPGNEGWTTQSKNITSLQDAASIKLFQDLFGEDNVKVLQSEAATAGTIVDVGAPRALRIVREVADITPDNNLVGGKMLEEASGGPCKARQPNFDGYVRRGGTLNKQATRIYEKDGYCIAAIRFTPSEREVNIPAGKELAVISVYRPADTVNKDVSQIASINFSWQPKGPLRWSFVDEGLYKGWVMLHTENNVSGANVTGAPWNIEALNTLAGSLASSSTLTNPGAKR